jgi:transcriptional regulator with XRE-family HTH domain
MDWEMAARQLLRVLRGRRSQVAFSRRLGYRSNVACDWEAGRRFPTAQRLLEICRALKRDVAGAFSVFQPACAEKLLNGRSFDVAAWLHALRGTSSVAALAARSGLSRYAITRFLKGRAVPRLPEFFLLVQTITGRASDLVGELVSIEEVPELLPDYQRRQAAKRLAFDVPWTEAVLRVIETEGYRRLRRHHPGYIARRLGISAAHEQQALGGLERAGILQRQGGRYRDAEPLSVDMAAAPKDIQQLKAHWAEVAMGRLDTPRPLDWHGYNVISVATADLERVREILRGAFREVRAIAAASNPVQSVALLNVELVTWPDE